MPCGPSSRHRCVNKSVTAFTEIKVETLPVPHARAPARERLGVSCRLNLAASKVA